jgi:hypothetical protein
LSARLLGTQHISIGASRPIWHATARPANWRSSMVMRSSVTRTRVSSLRGMFRQLLGEAAARTTACRCAPRSAWTIYRPLPLLLWRATALPGSLLAAEQLCQAWRAGTHPARLSSPLL